MRTRVIILLASQAGFVNVYFPTRENAEDFIAEWIGRAKHRIENGQLTDVETTLYSGSAPERPDKISWSVMAQYIIGMYIPGEESQSGAERLAKVQEKLVETLQKSVKQESEGEDWKG